MKKMYILTFLVMLVGGCSYDSGRIRLFNYNFWGGDTPSSVTVRKGDTLYSISRRYNVPMREMIEVNGLRPPYTLTIGRVLRLPAARYHVVAKGDTLYNISKRYNVDITSLSRSNRIAAPYTLAVGQRLVLPGSVVETAASPAYKTASHASVAAHNGGKSRSSSKKPYLPHQLRLLKICFVLYAAAGIAKEQICLARPRFGHFVIRYHRQRAQ